MCVCIEGELKTVNSRQTHEIRTQTQKDKVWRELSFERATYKIVTRREHCVVELYNIIFFPHAQYTQKHLHYIHNLT